MVLLTLGCGSELTIPIPSSDQPLLYLVLGDVPINQATGKPDTLLYAVLATAGTPIDSRARTATRFEMREASSGALYDWRPTVAPYSLGFGYENQARVAAVANYVLPWSSGSAGLGAADLVFGATYTLDIETEGVRIHGSTTLPARFDITVATVNGERFASWPHVKGAVWYFISVRQSGDQFGLHGTSRSSSDTLFSIPANFQSGDTVLVEARDANYLAALEDQAAGKRLGRVGIDTGFGVFAAVTRSTTVLP